MGQIGARELVVLAIIVLLIFGAKRLPDIARSLGKSARILKSETAAMKAESASAAPPQDGAAQPQAQEPPAKTIQAAPGDVTSSRTVDEAKPAAS
ncbi:MULTISPECIES: Sec-independent protein translocase subunit TatA [unclassified Streptomyces]|uniref:Sec-independent protein translocase protein TatA n=1 Tax=Streptomyces johnsoniae TaxID=3075532 RepID=A0ABU2SB40_9ACTN|nr:MULTISPECIES: Sec-independent protein translocase subunit TatA [unclassified Streptomyces]MDT0445891.1 Sec-independent protein translocase subunit TatA [Streptomyces sp. DSM 41886]ONK12723.1 twin arginine translocase protein A [Streptomyces sp. MP131-18]